MSNSISYVSYLASSEESIQHKNHLYEFQQLATMIAQEQLELYLPKIEAMVNNSISNAISNALSRAVSATAIDVNRIVDITIKQMNAQFHSEEVSKFVAENLKAELIKAFGSIDVKLIIS